MNTKLIPLLLLLTAACTFQVEVLVTPTPEPTQAILPVLSTSTPFVSRNLSATPLPLPTLTATGDSALSYVKPVQIKFPPDGTWVDMEDSITAGGSKLFVLYALEDQVMSVSILSEDADQPSTFEIEIKGEDGTVLCPTAGFGCPFWRGVLPASQQYFIKVTSQVADNFKLHVVINPPGEAKQYFEYRDPQLKFQLSYSDEFAAAHFAGAQATKFPPNFVLQYIDTPQYVPTNLSEAYFLLGSSSDLQAVATCTQPLSFGGPEKIGGNMMVNGVPFTKSQGGGVAAGNIYEQIYYRTVYLGTCYEITYFIHYANIGNYSPGAVKEFNRAAVLQTFDKVLATLVLH